MVSKELKSKLERSEQSRTKKEAPLRLIFLAFSIATSEISSPV